MAVAESLSRLYTGQVRFNSVQLVTYLLSVTYLFSCLLSFLSVLSISIYYLKDI